MNATAEAVLRSWSLDHFILAYLCLLVAVYSRGWKLLSRQLPNRFPRWRLICFITGVITVYIAVASPLDAFAGFLLQVHMIQHLLLTVVAPPLILLGSPWLPLLRGLPKAWVRDGIGPLINGPFGRTLIRTFGNPVLAWILFVGSTLTWHIPGLYDRALRYESWHAAEHFCFFVTGLLFWWHIVLPWPARQKWSRWLIIPYILSADLLNTVLASFLSFYDQPLYPVYETMPRLWGISVMDDQIAAGVIMWVPGSIAFLVPAFFITAKLLSPKRGVRPSDTPTKNQQAKQAEPRTSQPKGKPWITAIAQSPARRSIQIIMLLLAIAVIVDGFWGSEVSSMNLAGVLTWTYWRGFSVIALLTLGNLFCAVCPFTFFRNLAQRFLPKGRQRSWPKKLANKWPAVILLVIFLWAYEVFDLWDRPIATAGLIVAYFASIALIDSFFRKGSFCKYVCPIGQYHFAFSSISSGEVKVEKTDVCASCTTHDCLRGNEQQSGCETALFLPSKAGNMDCTFCLDCVRACPHDNITIQSVIPSQDLTNNDLRSTIGRYSERTDIAALLMVFCSGAFINAAGMTAPVQDLFQRITNQFGIAESILVSVFIIAGVVAVPLALGYLAAILTRTLVTKGKSCRELMVRFAYGFVPLGAAVWAAHFLFHLATGAFTAVPVFKRILADLGIGSMGDAIDGLSNPGFSGNWIINMEFVLLDAGLLASLYVLWRISERTFEKQRVAGFLIWASIAVLLFMAAIWIIFQPMEMRGTQLSGG
ncbi:cytochrome c oxidase assembly protein [Rubellicoccus peritrichatus]|uniref:Cytochrome c oxidase assembly protein n=1 Tax=Rubellicoccus peritrichatus TaxID=3080537 RepID=A0AAQ3L8N2_9BACT|nr:cytochrome c oxidase assembly protein [Puniceicoccus sp. CR14]WOO41684.1 cytochrome c oxidase assembly protein [Puniceicoccus sp. CR14]